MDTTGPTGDARREALQRQLVDLETALRLLKGKKNADARARAEYHRLQGEWARTKALLDPSFPRTTRRPATPVPELAGFSQAEAQLRETIEEYARLTLRADRISLQGRDLEQLLFTEERMKQQARALRLKNLQLELMLDRAIRRAKKTDKA